MGRVPSVPISVGGLGLSHCSGPRLISLPFRAPLISTGNFTDRHFLVLVDIGHASEPGGSYLEYGPVGSVSRDVDI